MKTAIILHKSIPAHNVPSSYIPFLARYTGLYNNLLCADILVTEAKLV